MKRGAKGLHLILSRKPEAESRKPKAESRKPKAESDGKQMAVAPSTGNLKPETTNQKLRTGQEESLVFGQVRKLFILLETPSGDQEKIVKTRCNRVKRPQNLERLNRRIERISKKSKCLYLRYATAKNAHIRHVCSAF
jgi:hypothetical protein